MMSESHFRRVHHAGRRRAAGNINATASTASLNLLRSTSEPIQNIAARTGFLHHDVQPEFSALRRAESLRVAKKCPKAHEWACGEKQPDGRFARK